MTIIRTRKGRDSMNRRRSTALFAAYEAQSKSENEAIRFAALDRMLELTLKLADLDDRAEERKLKRQLNNLDTPPAPATLLDAAARAKLKAELQADIDAKKEAVL